MDTLPLHFCNKIKYLSSLSICRAKTVAFITKGKYKILYSGHNDALRTKYLGHVSICQHAEMNVITQFINSRIRRNHMKYSRKNKQHCNQVDLHKYTLWVFRISNFDNNKVLNSAPCFHCSNAMKKLGLRKVIHTTNQNNLNKIDLRYYNTTHVSNAQKKWEIIKK